MINRNIRSAVITGPTGAVGTALVDNLLQKNIVVYAVVRPESKRIDSLPNNGNLHIVQCDAANLRSLPKMIDKTIDAFYHFAWAHTIGSGRNDMPSQIDNIRYAVDAADAASELGCKVFVGAGSQAECGRVDGLIKPDTPCFPENGYGMAKLCAGQMTRVECAKFGIDHVWMRILSIYGPNDGPLTMISSTIQSLLNGEKPALTEGKQMWDYLYSGDVAEAFYLAAESGVGGKVYPLGSGQARPLKEYIQILRDVIDPNLPLGFGDIPYSSNQVMHLQADISEFMKDTMFSPSIDFKVGIKKTVDSFLE